MLCCLGYSDRVVASFAQQIQSEYYGGNQYMPIEVIALEDFIASTKTETETTTQAYTWYAMFHSFFLIKSNKMVPQLFHTANTELHFWINGTLCLLR